MKSPGEYRGHEMIIKNDIYLYKDTENPVSLDKDRDCGYCHKANTEEGHDSCLGILKFFMNACCGHGKIRKSALQLENGFCIHWLLSAVYIKILKLKKRINDKNSKSR